MTAITPPIPPNGAGRPRGRRFIIRSAVLIAILAATWHIFASFLWISPPTPLRELVPGNALHSYMIPWYGQSWSVFAPEPINGDYALRVRALVDKGEGKDDEVTEWVNATAIEQSWATHHLFPPRAAGLSVRQASSFKDAWSGLTAEQQQTAGLNYFKGDAWLGRMRDAMLAKGGEKKKVITYIVQERYSDAYATQVARAVWGEHVIRVQYEVTRQNVIPFALRHDPDATRPKVQHTPTGWRGLITMPGQDQEAFAAVFAPAYKAYAKESER